MAVAANRDTRTGLDHSRCILSNPYESTARRIEMMPEVKRVLRVLVFISCILTCAWLAPAWAADGALDPSFAVREG